MSRPSTDPQLFATDTNYAAPGESWHATATKVDPVALRSSGFHPGYRPAAQHVNFLLADALRWADFLRQYDDCLDFDGTDTFAGEPTWTGIHTFESPGRIRESVKKVVTDNNLTLSAAEASVYWLDDSTLSANRTWLLDPTASGGESIEVFTLETTHIVTVSSFFNMRNVSGSINGARFRFAGGAWRCCGSNVVP